MERYVQSENELDGHRVASRTFKEQKKKKKGDIWIGQGRLSRQHDAGLQTQVKTK